MLRNYYKIVLLLPVLFFTLIANATNYYLANSGNDSNSGTDPSSPWQTLNKLNSFSGIQSGDNVYFNRGDVFYGSIVINSSRITFDAYGSGANPVITGFTTVNSWNNLGGNIWESSNAVSSLSSCNMVVVNGVNTPMGRYPNSGYLPYQSFSGNTSITSSSLFGTDWTGAVAVIKKERYIIDANPITSQSGNTLYYSNGGIYNGQAGWGVFIQNDSRTLDQQNEWYYNPSNGKLRIYSSTTPQNVQLSTTDNLIYSVFRNNITIQNISFTGANNTAFYIGSSSNMEVRNCSTDFCYNGIFGVNFGGSSNNFRFENSTINHSNNNGINLTNEFTNAFVSNNTIQNTGMIVGMGGNGDGTCQGMNISGANSTIQNNEVDNSGYIGIGFNGNYITIKNNFVNTFCMIKDDGGGIYSGNNATGNIISNNIVLNGIGNGDGTLNSSVLRAHGIFLDDNATGVQILNNSIANIAYAAIFLHNAQGIAITGNTTYNANIGLLVSNDNSIYTSNLTVQNNILVGTLSGQAFTPQNQICLQFATIHNNLQSFGNVDYNYYARPINDSNTLVGTLTGVVDNIFGLTGWQNYTNFDLHSSKSPKTIINANDLRFEYNASTSNKTVSLGANYIDVTGKSYNGTITLAPYTSAILIKNGASTNQSPTANAGSNGTITLPTNSVPLLGTGSDADGTITAYTWTQTSGPAQATFANSNSASTTASQLVEGTYTFQLQVTDNNGATGTSTVQVNVVQQTITNNDLPVANAGGNGTITLPTNSVSLTGTGTPSNGSISSYNWSVISGPSSGNITSPNSAATTVTGLSLGTYVFQLKVTDNTGATGTSTVQVNVVNPSGTNNISPVANAGGNGTITLPTNSVRLDGTGTDADGTITAYNWTQVSGPQQATFTNPNSASTNVTGMVVGTYIFQFQVTDNNGAIGTSTVQVNVANPSGTNNIPPVANAGGNGTITLPINSVRLDGTGTDADGTITAYNWTQVSGPQQATFTNPNSATTNVTGMVLGTYIFQFQVTDDNGATGTSTVQVDVVNNLTQQIVTNNVPPTANAGGNGTLTLPTNTVPLTGTGTDVDGTITAYNWTQVSGPAQGTFTSPNSSFTQVTGMVLGTYIFQLQVTDNNGATGTSTVQINVVNGAGNIAPVANAGGNGTITLPVNVVFLTGTGTDADGTITAYNWSQVSGPSAGNITSPNSAPTTVTGLIPGTYVFQFQVTDNNGATGTSTVQIRVVNSVSNRMMSPATETASSSVVVDSTSKLSVQKTDVNSPNLTASDLKASPNPFQDFLNITITGNAGKYNLILIDALGKTVLAKSGQKDIGTLQLSWTGLNFGSGVYFLQIQQNGKSSTIKLVKN